MSSVQKADIASRMILLECEVPQGAHSPSIEQSPAPRSMLEEA